ncbi:MAG: BREX-1 system adenine-specific DNA-methyltransferase PglX [Aeromonas sobria]
MSQQENNNIQKHFFRVSAADFSKIPGSPVAYWAEKKIFDAYVDNQTFADIAPFKSGMSTTNNDKFLRLWLEIDNRKMKVDAKSLDDAKSSEKKWFPYKKGGSFRRWAGNDEYVVNWFNDGEAIKRSVVNNPNDPNTTHWSRRIFGVPYFFKPSLTYSRISSSDFSVRYSNGGAIFSDASNGCFPQSGVYKYLAFLNSTFAQKILMFLCPTLNFMAGDVQKLPVPDNVIWTEEQDELVEECITISQVDWDSVEVSWGFCGYKFSSKTIKDDMLIKQEFWVNKKNRLKNIELRLDDIFNGFFSIPLSGSSVEYGNYLINDGFVGDDFFSIEVKRIISYAIGCMMGRYSLDREGLVYAYAGNEGFKALVEEGAYATFAADEDGILPLTADSWFPDDVAARFEAFIRTVWGAETLEENLQFIADSLCLAAIKPVKKGGETARETIRRYLSTQFFKDHMKTYKKRPIYWLFSSGKEKAFECLVYLHRYNEATLPRMRTEYVTPLLGQMAGRIERLRLQQTEASTSDAKRIGKEIDSLTKQLAELRAFDDQLKHHADMRITLDLDDGVKVNYGKFGTLLSDVKAITGDKGE